MSDVVVNPAQWEHPKEVGKNEPIRSDQVGGNVDISVKAAGCYAILIELVVHKLAGFDIVIGKYDGARAKCFCFEANSHRGFKWNGAAAPADKNKAPISIGSDPRDELDPVYGTWPTDDGAGDNTIQVFVRARVYRCPGKCESGKCKDASIAQLGTALVTDHTSDHDVDIYNGEGLEKAINVIGAVISIFKGIGGLFGGVIGMAGVPRRLGELESRIARLEERPGGGGSRRDEIT